MNPYDKAYELARALQSADAYVRLKEIKERIQSNQAALDMLQGFRRHQWNLESKRLTNQSISEEEVQALQKLAEVVSMHSDVNAYLAAEYQFSVLVSDVHRIIGESIQDAMLPTPNEDEKESQP